MTERLLIRGTHAITMDDGLGDITDCDILVEEGKIAVVEPGISEVEAVEIDGSHTIAVPGFVDTHRHTWETNVRGLLPHCTLMGYMVNVIENLGTHFRPEDVYEGNLLGSLEALNAGVTTIVDWSHISNSPDHADEAIRGLRDAGIRAVYAHGDPNLPAWTCLGSTEAHPSDAVRIRDEHFSSDDQLVTMALALRPPGDSSFDIAVQDFGLARELELPVTVHAGVRVPGTRTRDVTELYKLDLLGPDVTCVHCSDANDVEIDLIAESGTQVAIAPFCEMLMGHGYPPTGRLLRRGVRPSLSVDVATSVPGDMFTQMRTAYVAERARALSNDFAAPFAPTLTTRDVLSFATIDGARSCGLDGRIGSLTPGKQADIVLVRTDCVNVVPVLDAVATVVLFADTSNVDTVIVGGRVVKRGGGLLREDLRTIFERGEASRDYLLTRSGLVPGQIENP